MFSIFKKDTQKNDSTPDEASQNSKPKKPAHSALLMTPGPVLVPEQIMDTISLPIIHHRTEAFEQNLKWVLQNLPKIFKTTQKVFLQTCTGSGAMESAVVNTLTPGDKVLCIVNGKFGERWTEICKAYGMRSIIHTTAWGDTFNLSEIQEILNDHTDLKAVMCQACETSTGVLNPIKELAAIVKKTNAILIVDAITALGATPLAMDEWNLDVVIGGSQKAFMLPTGLSMISFSVKAWDMVEKSRCPKYYFDIRKEVKANEKNQTYFSSPVTHIRALRTSLEIILKCGVDEFIKRHELIAEALRAAGPQLKLQIFPKSPSPTVTAFRVPDGVDGERLQKIMEDKHHITIAGGQDAYKGKIIRIGHMGAIEKEHIYLTLEKLGLTLEELGVRVETKNAIAAAEFKLENLQPLPRL